MDPRTGEILRADQLEELRKIDPAKAERFSVKLEGPEHEIEAVSQAVRAGVSKAVVERRRAKNKAAHRARRAGR